MRLLPKTLITLTLVVTSTYVAAQKKVVADISESEQLKITALEMLISAPADRALPMVTGVLSGNDSDEVKSRALFILSQIDLPEAQAVLIEFARDSSSELKHHAIRMIGIGGDTTALAGLSEIYKTGDRDTKTSVLRAYLIADDATSVFEIAANAVDNKEFEDAVNVLGAMGATSELHRLRERGVDSRSVIHAYALADDAETLSQLALDGSNPDRQLQAIQGLGIIGGEAVNATLLEIYRTAGSDEVRTASLHGLMVAEHEKGLLELFRSSQNVSEKRELLHMLMLIESDAALDIIGETLKADD